jgi:YHS domain-containing protein
MKKLNLYIALLTGTFGVLAFSPRLAAAECVMPGCCSAVAQPMADEAKAKPDLLTTCPVSGDRIGGDMGKPYVFVYKGQEVKLCCSMCKKDFDKDPEKYLAKIRAADKK